MEVTGDKYMYLTYYVHSAGMKRSDVPFCLYVLIKQKGSFVAMCWHYIVLDCDLLACDNI